MGASSAICSSAMSGVEETTSLRDPQPVQGVDYLQVESTYGARVHAPKPDANNEVVRLVRETLDKKGKVIIPSFISRTHPADRLYLASADARWTTAPDSDLCRQSIECECD